MGSAREWSEMRLGLTVLAGSGRIHVDSDAFWTTERATEPRTAIATGAGGGAALRAARPAPLNTEGAQGAHHHRRKMLNDMDVKCKLISA